MKRQKAKKIPKSILTVVLLVREDVEVVDATRLGRGEVDDDGARQGLIALEAVAQTLNIQRLFQTARSRLERVPGVISRSGTE